MDIWTYTTCFNIIRHKFDYKGALANWATFADGISIAVNTSDDGTYEALVSHCNEHGYPVSIVQTDFSYEDPYMYGKIENAALQNCNGSLLIQNNLDERFSCNRNTLYDLGDRLINNPNVGAYFVPVINLYGSIDKYLDIGYKWRIHKEGYFRGPVNFGIKADGRPNYDLTSSDELVTRDGNLVPTIRLLDDLSIESVRQYVSRGMPMSYHLGFLDLKDRLDRSIWWKKFWESATAGDKNGHAATIEELARRETKDHGLPLWRILPV